MSRETVRICLSADRSKGQKTSGTQGAEQGEHLTIRANTKQIKRRIGITRTEPNGEFEIERPLPVGTFEVIVDRLMLNESDPSEGSLASLKIDNAYANDVSTPLSLEVAEGKNKYEITLQPPQPKKSKAR